jgi:6-pyruvoyltetrahydropterin/6-carboxytetrahydropterin synthase
MFEVSVEDSFAAGHALRGYRGKCENPHGHNYKVQITLHGEQLDNIGLLFDFKDLKLAMNDIIERLDHKFINDIVPFTDLNPSAENMAKYFYDEINVLLRDKTSGRVKVKLVRMWETDTTVATYFE